MGNNPCNAKLKRLPGVPTVYPDVRPEQKVGISPRDGRRGGLAVTMYVYIYSVITSALDG